MNTAEHSGSDVEILKRTFITLKKTQRRLQEFENARREPIAVIGLACRLPGGSSGPEKLWEFLEEGRDACREIPPERWEALRFYAQAADAPGMTHVVRANFLTEPIDGFDAHFFGISGKEAVSMDPQQRLLLEVTWEAMEDAGLDPRTLHGSQTGVYVGISSDDYTQAHRHSGRLELIDGYALTGTCFAPAAGRISYTFGLEGPSMAVDTACSSSLVALHLACQSLRERETNLALAGGVNLMLSPVFHICSTKLGTISPDGLCKTFDASANGYGRGEGCGMVALKRLSDALADGDRILGLIRGSAVNQDGKSNGLTAPNGLAQEKVIRRALENAGLSPADLDVIEVHGTGTSLGDPIEVESIGRIMQPCRSKQNPVILSTVKTNIGHLEAAAGIAGVIKTIQCLRHGQIPPHLHLRKPSPHIPWDQYPIAVSRELTPWPKRTQPRRAGVSSFGFSGTNAHVILEEAPAAVDEASPGEPSPRLLMLPLSAKSPEALRELTSRYLEFLGETSSELADVCHTAGVGRSHFGHRLAVVGSTAAEMREALRQHLDGGNGRWVAASHGTVGRPKVAFLFTGQGSQYVGMGRALYESSAVYREALGECDEIARGLLDVSLVDLLYGPQASEERLKQTQYTQPAIFAVEYALDRVWRSWGIEPDVVCGHSIGEFVAAHVAGVMSLADAFGLVVTRGRLMQALPAGGAMAAVFASEEQVAAALKNEDGAVSLAAVNGAREVVISGRALRVQAVRECLRDQGVTTQELVVSHAFHSALMRPMVEAFEAAARGVRFEIARVPVISTVTGRKAEPETLGRPEYWSGQVGATVRFAAASEALAREGVKVFLEVGAMPILTGLAKRSVNGEGRVFLGSLKRGEPDWEQMVRTAANLYAHGLEMNWTGFPGERRRRKVALPNYPFQRKSYYLNPVSDAGRASTAAPPGNHHPYLGCKIESPCLTGGAVLYQNLFAADHPAFLREHLIFDKIISPAAAHLSMALSAARTLTGRTANMLSDVSFTSPLVLDEDESRVVQTIVENTENGEGAFRLVSRWTAESNADWQTHCAGRLAPANASPSCRTDLEAIAKRCPAVMDRADFYALIEAAGYRTGPNFQGIREIHKGENEALCRIEATAPIDDTAIHPGLMDSILQTVLPACEKSAGAMLTGESVLIPLHIGSVRVMRSLAGALFCHTQVSVAPGLVKCDITAYDAQGEPALEIREFLVKQTHRQTLYREIRPDDQSLLYCPDWKEMDAATLGLIPTAGNEATTGLAFVTPDRWGAALAAQSRRANIECLEVVPGDGTAQIGLGRFTVNPLRAEEMSEFLARQLATAKTKSVNVIFAWSASSVPAAQRTAEGLETPAQFLCASLLHIVQALSRWTGPAAVKLWIVTRHAQSVVREDPAIEVSVAALWGFGRAIATEYPALWGGLVDMDGKASEADFSVLVSMLGSVVPENQIALRRGGRIFASRLTRLSARTPKQDTAALEARIPARSENQGYLLEVGAQHTLDDLVFKTRPRKAPGPGEVEILIHAAGLNFRDVLNALGQYPGAAGLLGFECSGTILSAGSEVSGLRVGDAVIAMASPGCLASHLTIDRTFVVPKPRCLTFEEAVTLPAGFLTAYYALHVLGKMQPGDRVLIHAAAGGVGLAAVQLALRTGAEVFATVGSPEKREFLAALGVKHILNSRTLDFAEEIRAITQGAGVTMVLNSLTGDFISKSFSVLARHGRFLEMGKIGIWDEARVRALDPTLAYHPFDLAAVARGNPGLVAEMFRTLLADLEAGTLRPLPSTVFPLSEAVEAFRFMAQAKHIGKIVLSRGAELRRETRQRDGILHAEATYLVTGGLGALGLLVAKWLVAEGARHLILVGRNEPKAGGLDVIQELREGGAEVQTFRADVSDAGDVSRLMAHIRNSMPPLKGVIHAAGVLDDGMLADLTGERFRKVMAPKARGAWNLHLATQPETLDFFVLFSSIAAIIGNLGQANYAAANAFLDGLAAHRRKLGQPGTSINWGPWAESGMAAALSSERFSTQGIRFLNPGQGLRLLRQILQQDLGHVCAMDMDWRAYADRHGLAPSAGFFAEVVSAGRKPVAAAAATAERRNLAEQLGRVLPMERLGLLVAFLQELAREVLGYSDSEVIAPDQALGDQGFDSLMTVDMRNRLGKILDCSLPASLLFDHPTLERMADYLLRDIIKLDVTDDSRTKAADESGPSAESVLREIDDLVSPSP